MLRCREITKLVSESMEHPLPWYRRLEVRVHLMMCGLCRGFAKHAKLLRNALRRHPERVEASEDELPGLSPEARRQIVATLRKLQS